MIQSPEDVKKYIDRILNGLNDLGTISLIAGLPRYASIFLALEIAFSDRPEEIDTIADMMHMYIKNRLARPPYNLDFDELLKSINPQKGGDTK